LFPGDGGPEPPAFDTKLLGWRKPFFHSLWYPEASL